VLKKEPFQVFPDFIQGGTMDASGYDDGRGSVRVRAKIEPGKEGTLVIRELPFGTTTESLMATIEDAARRKRVPVKAINDFTSEAVEIELTLAPEADSAKTIQKLYAFTACEVSLSSNITVIRDGRPCNMTVGEVIKANTRHLLAVLKRELTHRRGELTDAIHARTLTRIFIEERLYKKIESCRTQEAVYEAVFKGLEPYRKELPRDVTKKDVEGLLALQIRRISLFDINKNKQEIEALQGDLEKVERALANITGYAVRTLQGLIRKYEATYPRRTAMASFAEVKVKELTAAELDISYDKKTGYLGHQVKGTSLLHCSSFDKLLLVWKNGTYKVIPPPDKVFVDKHLLYCAPFDRERVFTLIYTNLGFTYIKRFSCGGTIMNRDYPCTLPDSKVLLFQEGTPEQVYVKYKPAKGQRIHQQQFVPADTPVKGVKARGNQMTSKAIDKLTTRQPSWWNKKDKTPGGVLT
jgi:topoisomerase-4 subunit A